MMQLSALLWSMALIFGYIGFRRGWNKEVIAMSGIILALFGLFQFDTTLREVILANIPPTQVFIIQSLIFGIIVFLPIKPVP